MYKFKILPYLTYIGFLASAMTIFGLLSYFLIGKWVCILLGGGIIQLFDVLFLALSVFLPESMILFSGVIAGFLFDLLSGSGFALVVIPCTLLVRFCMFLLIKLFIKKIKLPIYFSFLIALLPVIILYPLYTLLLFDLKLAIIELYIDLIQCFIVYFLALFLFTYFNRNLPSYFVKINSAIYLENNTIYRQKGNEKYWGK